MITPINGRSGRIQFNGTNLNVDDINATFSTDEVKVTGFEDQQADGRTPTGRTDGVDDFTATLSGYINTTAVGATAGMPAATAVDLLARGLVQGAIVTAVRVYLDKAVLNRWAGCTRCQIFRVNYMTKVTDGWKYSMEVKCAGGVITHPT